MSGFGRYTEEYWSQAKEKANGKAWTTEENRANGILYGALNGGWEGAQWFLGGELIKTGEKLGVGVLPSLFRVGTNTTLNAADTSFRALTKSLIDGTKWKEEFEKAGGVTSTLISAGIGLAGSILAELKILKDANNSKNQVNEEVNTVAYQGKTNDKINIENVDLPEAKKEVERVSRFFKDFLEDYGMDDKIDYELRNTNFLPHELFEEEGIKFGMKPTCAGFHNHALGVTMVDMESPWVSSFETAVHENAHAHSNIFNYKKLGLKWRDY